VERICAAVQRAAVVTNTEFLLWPCSSVDRTEKLGHFGGVERTSAWVTRRPAAGQKNGPVAFYFDTFFAASVSAAC